MRKPNLFLVGGAKCGTTALNRLLGQHPDIFMSPLKEPHFFTSEKKCGGLGDIGPRCETEKDYLSLFKNAKNEKYLGEASVKYLTFEEVPEKIYKFNSSSVVLVNIREPKFRIASYYNSLRYHIGHRKSQPYKDFEKEYFFNDGKVSDLILFNPHIKRYYSIFKDKMAVVPYEDFRRDNLSMIRKVYSFLQVNSDFIPKIRVINKSGRPRIPLFESVSSLFDVSFSAFEKMGGMRAIKRIHPGPLGIMPRINEFALSDSVPMADMDPKLENKLKEDWEDTLSFCREKGLFV